MVRFRLKDRGLTQTPLSRSSEWNDPPRALLSALLTLLNSIVHSSCILSFLVSGHGAKIRILILRSVDFVEHFGKFGDPESKVFSL